MGTIKFQGRDVQATEIDFLTRREEWNEYQLSNGKVLKVKLVLSDVYEVKGELTQEGEPIYQIESTTLVRVK